MLKLSLRCVDPTTATLLKLAAAVLIFASSSAGVAIPLVLRRRRSGGVFLGFAMAKAFVAGVILATALVHMLPEAWKSLALASGWIWSKFPVAGFVAMMAALGTVLIECLRMKGKEKGKEKLVNCASYEEGGLKSDGDKQVRHPLISKAQFENHKEILMAFFYAITTPIGIAVGAIAMALVYDPRSSVAMVAEAIADSLSAGILIYMSLVDLIVMDLLELLKRSSFSVQVGMLAALIGGAVLMSLLALWA
ncbi:Zinc transporter 3 [Dendrobium catenatum]|uniref:Zinc transporter 3 n=1 Tax=Dendrobium catenatum TaxID=906689 RepID=A0A2I0W602_9ASPA|nr:Zinc transporter 3 [Dendrobium catenatum]